MLGTGTTGAPIARNLLRAGFEVAVWNRVRRDAARRDLAAALDGGRRRSDVAGRARRRWGGPYFATANDDYRSTRDTSGWPSPAPMTTSTDASGSGSTGSEPSR